MTKKKTDAQILSNIPAMDLVGFEHLAALALDLRWSWTHEADEIWRQIDPDFWESTHNPWSMLQTVSRDKIASVLANPSIKKKVKALVAERTRAAKTPTWFQKNYGNTALKCIAYFCMEFMLSESLPIYSGGLGNVAGDQLKAASDLGVPVIGIGLLYQQGYFRQVINKEGYQQAFYPCNDFWQLPIVPVRHDNGEWLRLQLDVTGLIIWLRIWQVRVGHVKLYLLDSNDPANYPPYRGITSELYGGDPRTRLLQELILGIGGFQLLSALNIWPDVCHLNEGHAGFAILERARYFMEQTGQSFYAALAATRAGNLFTTHTAVEAGFDRFDPLLVDEYLTKYAQEKLGISKHELLALGRANPNNDAEPFNMAYLAIHGSGAVNAVSRLHGKVSRALFEPLFPRWPTPEVPVGHVTNGIHTPSWHSEDSDILWTQACGTKRWVDTTDHLEEHIRQLSDDLIWDFRSKSIKKFVDFIRERLKVELTIAGEAKEVIESICRLFNPNILTLGFARRFATYKRTDLLLRDPERLTRLLTNPEHPVQLVIAGKAHPADLPGQALIHEWIEFIRRPGMREHVVFLSDHDMLLTAQMVQGVDVWLNTPRRPWEACGTSGMKILVNGGLNLSELDGWWAEAYTKEVGWALGDGHEHGDDPAWDAKEAEDLFNILEQDVIPKFYRRNKENIPTEWIKMMRESMAHLTPEYSTNRVVRQYVEEYYLQAATHFKKRSAHHGALGAEIAKWQQLLYHQWQDIHFGAVKVEEDEKQQVFEVDIFLNAIDPKAVRVELYANGINEGAPLRIEMKQVRTIADVKGGYVYRVVVPAKRQLADYTVRIIPNFPGVVVPLEAGQILWQR